MTTTDRNSVAEHLDGEDRARRGIQAIHCDPDSIARAIANCLAADGHTIPITPRFLGLCRVLRKTLEGRRQ